MITEDLNYTVIFRVLAEILSVKSRWVARRDENKRGTRRPSMVLNDAPNAFAIARS